MTFDTYKLADSKEIWNYLDLTTGRLVDLDLMKSYWIITLLSRTSA